MFESLEDCARRETVEETGLIVPKFSFLTVTNDIFESTRKHYLTVFMVGYLSSGRAKVQEADKIDKWNWFSWDLLPKPLFLPIQQLVNRGVNPIMQSLR